MEGINTILLNKEEMIKIVQYYFDNVLFKEKVNVDDIEQETKLNDYCKGFKITMMKKITMFDEKSNKLVDIKQK